LNSRPTVYERTDILNDFDAVGIDQVRSRAHEALAELATGRHEFAGRLLAGRAVAGDEAARAALEGAARGMWRGAIELFAKLGAAATGQLADVGAQRDQEVG
jgi:2-phospho-L-lactate transferase/gluconeogenesis factor (CofD/UPF0052 family)